MSSGVTVARRRGTRRRVFVIAVFALAVLFLAIAILTMITNMNRITISEKTQIGTLKALGLPNRAAAAAYGARHTAQ